MDIDELLHKRSAWNFVIFLMFVLWMSIYITKKGEEALAEIQQMSSSPVYLNHDFQN